MDFLLNRKWTVFVLVVVGITRTIHGQTNYASRKFADQIDNYLNDSAKLAVDGDIYTCTSSVVKPNPWWKVDLGRDYIIRYLKLRFHPTEAQVVNLNYSVEVEADGALQGVRCEYSLTNPNISNPTDWTCFSPVIGRKVSITAHANVSFTFCEVEVYGDCVNGTYGNDCQNTCGHCNPDNPLCDKKTGACPGGCEFGWTGSVCNETCQWGRYGNRCSSNCGHCANNQTCNIYNGNCPDSLCDPGWQEGLCQNACAPGFYGVGCQKCGACINNACDHVNGTCTQCESGWQTTDPQCFTPCDYGTWGDGCIKSCGICASADRTDYVTCNKSTGYCDNGCGPGYMNDIVCRTLCPNGTWGFNCLDRCGKCGVQVNDTDRVDSISCRGKDGACMTGCLPGYQGINCIDSCSKGTYGLNCILLCGECIGDCDVITGECSAGCKDGYTGTKCDQPCVPGFYGAGCQRKCPINCDTNCSNVDGSCVCKDGWTGLQCSQVCKHNHYGKNCEFPCGNCLPGTSCDQGTGYCPVGCATDWTGLKCDAAVIREFYEPDHTGAIVGGVFGVIGLGLIIAFVVWVVWRYRHDKSIHIRELASSLKRISLRGSKNLRRSFQRLSMRMRRGGDQRGLDRNAEAPATSNHHQKNRAAATRMYDCVKIQSNVLHFDDFCRVYLHLQQSTEDGRTMLHQVFKSFLEQRPRDHNNEANGDGPRGYYNVASEDAIEIHMDNQKSSVPAFLPLGSNLSGFLLVSALASSDTVWNHLQQRQMETLISIGKESSFSWRPGERITINNDMVQCVDVQLYGSHRESKLIVQRQGTSHRRTVLHLECFFFTPRDKFPQIKALLMFMERFSQLHSTQKGRSIMINFLNMREQAILFSLVASLLDILLETKRVDILRAVATGGNATAKSIRTFEEFKYINDVVYNYCAADNSATSV